MARRDEDPLQTYFARINETPLLSPQEEKELARRVAEGDIQARDHMIRANLRLSVHIARSYLGKGLSVEDLIEEGNLGLMRAVEGFSPDASTRFSTYASHWIKQSIRRALINQGRTIRLPAYMVNLIAKWKRTQAALAIQLGRPPTPDEVGAALHLPAKKIAVLLDAITVNDLAEWDEDL